jgi:hypothetical protein
MVALRVEQDELFGGENYAGQENPFRPWSSWCALKNDRHSAIQRSARSTASYSASRAPILDVEGVLHAAAHDYRHIVASLFGTAGSRHRSCLHHVLAAVGRWRTTVAHHHPRRTRRLGHVRENWDYLSENGQEGSNAGRCRSPQVDIMLLIGQPLKRYRQTSGSLRVAHGDAFCPPGGEQPTVSRCGNELDIVRRDCCGAVGGVVAAQSVKH